MPSTPPEMTAQRRTLLERLKPPVVAHRGAALHAPENTLASLRKAAALGARWVEFDVKLSRDAVPFLLHDPTVDRTTDGSGRAADMAWADLQRLDAGGWFGAAFRGERLPSLEETLALLLELDLEANLEIKPCRGREVETAKKVMATLATHWPRDRPLPLISSFARKALATAREVAPEFPRGLLLETLEPGWQRPVAELACATLHLDHKGLSPAELELMAGRDMPVLCYTVNDAARAKRLLGWGAKAIISDAPDRVLAAIEA